MMIPRRNIVELEHGTAITEEQNNVTDILCNYSLYSYATDSQIDL